MYISIIIKFCSQHFFYFIWRKLWFAVKFSILILTEPYVFELRQQYFSFSSFLHVGFPNPCCRLVGQHDKVFTYKLLQFQIDHNSIWFLSPRSCESSIILRYIALCALASFPNYLQLIWAHFQFCNPRYFQIRNPNAPSAGQWSCRRRNSLFPFRISIEMLRTSCATGRRSPLHFHFATDLDDRHWGIRRIWTPALEVIR